MKYVIANIKVPIGFNDDQSIKTFMERISIDFVSCTELPPIPPENEFKNDKFLKNLKEFFQKSTNLPDSVEPDEPEEPEEPEPDESESELKEQPKCSPHYVSKNELLLKPSKYTHNTSFKNKIKNNNSHHFTFKNKSQI